MVAASEDIAERHEGAYFEIWSLERVLSAMTDQAFDFYRERYPHLLIVGTDGGSEMIGYDFRKAPPAVVLVNVVSTGWHDACYQAPTLAELVADLRGGGSFRFGDGYS